MTDLPSGPYTGTVHGPLRFLNRIWQGKVFTGATVLNRIFGYQLVSGAVRQTAVRSLYGWVVEIRYWFGLIDTLTPQSSDGSRWDGTVAFLGVRLPLRFTLVRKIG